MNTYSIYETFFNLKSTIYALSFVVPRDWCSDLVYQNELGLLALLTPKNTDFTKTNIFISLKLIHKTPNNNLVELEEAFYEEGYVKDTLFSSLKTFDQRSITVLKIEDKESEYFRKNALILLKENFEIVLMVGFQINLFDKKYEETCSPIFEGMLRSLKIEDKISSKKTIKQYALNLESKLNISQFYENP